MTKAKEVRQMLQYPWLAITDFGTGKLIRGNLHTEPKQHASMACMARREVST